MFCVTWCHGTPHLQISELESAAFGTKIELQHKDDEIAKLKKRFNGFEAEKADLSRQLAEARAELQVQLQTAKATPTARSAPSFAAEATINDL